MNEEFGMRVATKFSKDALRAGSRRRLCINYAEWGSARAGWCLLGAGGTSFVRAKRLLLVRPVSPPRLARCSQSRSPKYRVVSRWFHGGFTVVTGEKFLPPAGSQRTNQPLIGVGVCPRRSPLLTSTVSPLRLCAVGHPCAQGVGVARCRPRSASLAGRLPRSRGGRW